LQIRLSKCDISSKQGETIMETAYAAIAQGATSLATQVIHDNTAANVITGTLNRLNAGGLTGSQKLEADFQFQKEVLSAAGIGAGLDMRV
jgi:hypothetical protein